MDNLKKQLLLNKKAYAREKNARKEAESILNKKSLELYNLNKELERANKDLDKKVHERTAELNIAKEFAEQQSAALEVSNERFNLAVHASSAGIWEWNLETGVHYFSDRLCQILGYEHHEIEAAFKNLSIIRKADRLNLKKAIHQHLLYRSPLNCECQLLLKNGDYKWFVVVGRAVWDENGKATRVAGSLTDIHERVENALLINKMAHHDVLTELPNRMFFDLRLEEVFERTLVNEKQFAILIIDVNDFKVINDTYGHAAGDHLLKEISFRFKSLLDREDTIARMGGDEFSIIIHDIENSEQLKKITDALIFFGSHPVYFDGTKINPKFSIGVAIFPEHGNHRSELMMSADYAMYEAKKMKTKGCGYEIFKEEFKRELHERRRIGKDIFNAIETKQFYLHYQPLVTLPGRTCSNVEALLRWKHPLEGTISPADFIPIAEDSGLILQLGELVFEMACQQIHNWLEQGHRITVAINISPVQFANQNLPEMFCKYIKQYAIPADLVEIEITETVLMHKLDQVTEILKEIHAMGIKVSLDDFGTGYSSLSYLQQLPINKLKIDRIFINDVVTNKERQVITITIIQMAHALGLKVVAEGIETEEQLSFLEKHGCDILQGFYLHRPMSGDKILNALQLNSTKQVSKIDDNLIPA